MTKNELKAVIKECMLEILAEGLGNSLNEVSQKKKQAQQIVEKREMAQRQAQHRQSLANNVTMATKDPVLQQILQHTAQTTLKEQLANEIRTPSVHGMQHQMDDIPSGPSGDPGIDISSIFGGASQNWATAAFAPTKKPL